MRPRHLVAKRKHCSRLIGKQSSCLFSTILFMAWLQENNEAKGWECLLKSVSRAPHLPRSWSFSLSLHILRQHWFLCFSTMLLLVVISGLNSFLHSIIPASSISFEFICWGLLLPSQIYHLHWVVQRKRKLVCLQLALALSSSTHAPILTLGQHPSWVLSASHIFLCLASYSS